ncbi:MAG: Rpp14/Pop5 family protein [Methanomicrobiales archaeon]|nr:Rpp14/Pop5 family protein [Methanomicrobiales archaeon]
MRPRPPSLRVKKRYVLTEIVPPWISPDVRSLSTTVHEAITSLWGDASTALMQPAVVYAEPGIAILRCRRGTERNLITALSTVVMENEQPIALHPQATSGTILSLKKRCEYLRQKIRVENIVWRGKNCTAYRFRGHKVDLLERGIKGQNVIFFTDDDCEEM